MSLRSALRRLYAALVAVTLLVLAGGARAGEDPVAAPPPDAPLVVQPAALRVPPVPPEFERRDLGWLQIAYPSGAFERVRPLMASASEMRAKLSAELGQPVLDRVEVRVARSPEEMAALAPVDVPPPAYASGVAYRAIKLVLLTMTAPRTQEGTDLDEVFRHELAHVAIDDAVAGHHVPLWFHEGVAIHESGEHALARTRALFDATLSGTLVPLADLDRVFPREPYEVSIAYAESADFVRFLRRRADSVRFAALIARVREGQSFDRALADAYGVDGRRIEYQWKQELEKRFNHWPLLAGGSLVWGLVFAALVAAYVKRRRRARATLARWEREEASYDAAIRRAREAVVPAEGEVQGPVLRPSVPLPKVEHDGRWHTLH